MSYVIISTKLTASTAFHALELGFRTCLVEDASRGINDESIGDTFNRILEENGCVVNSKEVFIFEDLIFCYLWFQVKAMVQGKDRRLELGWKLAMECRKKINYPAKNKNSKYNSITP